MREGERKREGRSWVGLEGKRKKGRAGSAQVGGKVGLSLSWSSRASLNQIGSRFLVFL